MKKITIALLFILSSVLAFAAAPTITLVAVTATTSSTATVTWTTNIGATSQVIYGVGNIKSATAVDGRLLTSHSVTVTGLTSGVVYSFSAVSQDIAGNSTTSSAKTFGVCGGISNTQLTATINAAYEYGNYTITLVNDSGSNATPNVCGNSLTTPVTGNLDQFGNLAVSLPDNNLIVPAPSHWSFNVTSLTGGGAVGSATATAVVTGAYQDISSAIQAAVSGKLQHVFYDPATSAFNPPISSGGSYPATPGVAACTGTPCTSWATSYPVGNLNGDIPVVGASNILYLLGLDIAATGGLTWGSPVSAELSPDQTLNPLTYHALDVGANFGDYSGALVASYYCTTPTAANCITAPGGVFTWPGSAQFGTTGSTQLSGKEWTGTTVTVPTNYDYSYGVTSGGTFACQLASGSSCMPANAVTSVFGATGTIPGTFDQVEAPAANVALNFGAFSHTETYTAGSNYGLFTSTSATGANSQSPPLGTCGDLQTGIGSYNPLCAFLLVTMSGTYPSNTWSTGLYYGTSPSSASASLAPFNVGNLYASNSISDGGLSNGCVNNSGGTLGSTSAACVTGGAATEIPFGAGATANLSYDPNYTWNTTLEYLGLGNQAAGNQLAPGNLVGLADNTYNTTIQFNIQNKNAGTNVSGDYVITDGTNTAGYGDFGCNGANYAQPLYNSGSNDDCYILAVGTAPGNGNLLMSTGTANTSITQAIGGSTVTNVIETLSNPGGTAPSVAWNNPIPIIGATLPITAATLQTAQTFTITGVTCVGSTMTAAGTITGGGSSAYAGWAYTFSGFGDNATNAGMYGNNGTFIVTSSTGAQLVATNPYCIAESAPPAGAQAVSSATTTFYTGTFTGGAPSTTYPNGVYAYILPTVTIGGTFTNSTNKGNFVPIASTATILAVTNASGVTETGDTGTVQSTSVINSPTVNISAPYGTGTGTWGSDLWTMQDIMGSVATNPTSTLTWTHSGTSGTVAEQMPSSLLVGTGALVPTLGTAGGMFAIEGTAPTGASTNYGWYNNSTRHCFDIINQTVDIGCGLGAATTTQYGIPYGGATAGTTTFTAAGGANFPLVGSATVPGWSTIGWLSSASQWGIPYMSTATQMSSTAALTANALIKAGNSAAPSASSITDDGKNITTSEVFVGGNKSFVTGDFTDSTTTTLMLVTGLSYTLPTSKAVNVSFHCMLLFDQGTSAVSDSIGIGVTGTAPTQANASATVFTNTTAPTNGTLTALASTTPTAVVTFTPSAITTIWSATLDGTIEQPSNATPGVFGIYVSTSTGADNFIVKRGSYCTLF
jgi:hypothetical protein